MRKKAEEITTHQTEGSENRQTLDVCEAQLHQTQCDDDAVENVPAHLEVVVGIHCNQLENHLRREDPSENLLGGDAHKPDTIDCGPCKDIPFDVNTYSPGSPRRACSQTLVSWGNAPWP